MGPTTSFDKSFLQSLTVDESVWFDHFFITNVCPLFYVETLADLDKKMKTRSAEREVAIIAGKFPEMHGMPNAHHVGLCLRDLLGDAVPMTGQIYITGGHPVNVGGTTGTVVEQSPEAEALLRWQKGEFLNVERQFARAWRDGLAALPLTGVAERFREMGIDAKLCRSMKDAKALAENFVSGSVDSFAQLQVALYFLQVPVQWHSRILRRWSQAGRPALAVFAPYASYVLSVELFFHVAVAANHISGERSSNLVDISYLFYLPFCMMFVSNDRLHQKCAPLFLRGDQEFVWGLGLKGGLTELNSHYQQLPDEVKQAGVYSFADGPARVGSCFVAKLHERLLLKSWEWFPERKERSSPETGEDGPPTAEEIQRMAEAPGVPSVDLAEGRTYNDRFVIEHRATTKKGSWYQIPKDA